MSERVVERLACALYIPADALYGFARRETGEQGKNEKDAHVSPFFSLVLAGF